MTDAGIELDVKETANKTSEFNKLMDDLWKQFIEILFRLLRFLLEEFSSDTTWKFLEKSIKQIVMRNWVLSLDRGNIITIRDIARG
jgi:hypothetical protein